MALAGDPHYPPIKLDLAEVLIHSSDLDSAEKLLKDPPFQQQKEAAVKILAAQLVFARSVQFAASPAALKRRLTADPDDLASRYQLGALSAVKGDYADALAHFFEIMKRDRRFNDDIGKHSLLKVFEILGDENALVHHYRRKMASLLH
jgi:putative thioredoxin